ncbi:MFS transporter [Rhodovulum kholense]|uniref:Putative MFS family arabinose efflux permease n=1 Tax=Rhodovulum kholense TaxID=453584 RepID=A0A8E3ASA4_9RHOB|nr:MFS transporter [Rhodovulum kholense]PTW52009.1 putative MFS family arabinose efflux permease [Rhodovulum kholense]
MTSDTAPSRETARARRNVTVLVLAQAFLGAQMSMIFTMGGLAGQTLAPNPCFATLPISLIVLGSMLSAGPLSGFMQRAGRRAGFLLGIAGGAAGAAIAALGLYQGSFGLFLAGSLLTGLYMSAQGFYRFAAADTAEGAFQPKAISYVLAGGLVAAILGPQLVKVTAEAMVIPFLGSYLVAIGINLSGVLLFAFLDIPRPPPRDPAHHRGRSRADLLRDPAIAVAIICGMVSYALMNLVMTSTPLAVVGCGFDTGTAADIVTAHVLAMYVPSFFTGHLIARFGARPIVALGLAILAAAGAVALTGVEIERFLVTLILLGIGWNFGFIGATAMLAQSHGPEERGAVQGMNDILVFGGVTLASLASGGLMNCSASSAQEGWTAVNMAMVPFLALAGGALIWLTLRPKDQA